VAFVSDTFGPDQVNVPALPPNGIVNGVDFSGLPSILAAWEKGADIGLHAVADAELQLFAGHQTYTEKLADLHDQVQLPSAIRDDFHSPVHRRKHSRAAIRLDDLSV
jgi:hypothetical protein